MHCLPTYWIVACAALALFRERAVFAGPIPSQSAESKPSICDKHKVVCDSGWSCQAGFLLFPPEERVKCDSDEDAGKDCEPRRNDPDSVEVFCVRDGHLGLVAGRRLDDSRLLIALRGRRQRRGACIEMCTSSDDCLTGEVCMSNGCGHVCGKKARM